MKKYLLGLFAIAILFLGCNKETKGNKTIRYGMVTGVHPDKLDYYKKLYAKP